MWRCRRLVCGEELRAFLEQDREYAAYALGDCEPPYVRHATWWGGEWDGDLRAVALVYAEFDPPVLFLMGDPDGLTVVLGTGVRERSVYLTCRETHLPAVGKAYRLLSSEPMYRMVLRPERFRPVRGDVVRLTPMYVLELERLYALGGGDAFRPAQIHRGVFYGVMRYGRLIAAAGTHLVAPEVGVAAVGNVFTDPRFRGCGLATRCTSAVVAELLERGFRTVVLNVRRDNEPALAVYRKLGFEVTCAYLEGLAERRSAGLGAWADHLSEGESER